MSENDINDYKMIMTYLKHTRNLVKDFLTLDVNEKYIKIFNELFRLNDESYHLDLYHSFQDESEYRKSIYSPIVYSKLINLYLQFSDFIDFKLDDMNCTTICKVLNSLHNTTSIIDHLESSLLYDIYNNWVSELNISILSENMNIRILSINRDNIDDAITNILYEDIRYIFMTPNVFNTIRKYSDHYITEDHFKYKNINYVMNRYNIFDRSKRAYIYVPIESELLSNIFLLKDCIIYGKKDEINMSMEILKNSMMSNEFELKRNYTKNLTIKRILLSDDLKLLDDEIYIDNQLDE